MASGPRGDNLLKNLGIPLNHVPRPRAPPRLIRPPSPFYMERPQPIVPDVSLIIDSTTTSFHSNSGNTLNEENFQAVGNNVQSQFALPRTRNASVIMAESNSENSPNMNFANYYPTPPQNSSSRSNDNVQNSSNATRGELSHSPLSRTASSRDDTSASENLPLDENNTTSKSDRSISSSGYESLKEDLASVMETVRSQGDSINKISSQLQKIVAFQEKFLVHIVRKGSGISKGVQTDEDEVRQTIMEVNLPRRSSGSSPEVPKKAQVDKSASLQGKRSAVNSEAVSVHSNSKRASPSIRQELLKNKVSQSSATAPVVAVDEKKGGGGEDLSAILRSLQISNVNHPSTYSDTSMKSIDFPPFNDETFQNETSSSYIGPSASAQGSDVEDDLAETIFPSVTYYNNLLSTVNRILDGGQQQSQEPNNPTSQDQENTAGNRPSSSASSKRQIMGMNRRNSGSSGASSPSIGTASYSSGSMSIEHRENVVPNERNYCNNEFKENFPPTRGTGDANFQVNKFVERHNRAVSTDPNDNAVESTKKYLQSLGVQFDNPAHSQPSPPLSQKQNYMIQQNVYNSIYIPTVNCVPVISESVNSNSGLIDNLARKYIPSGERNQYEMMAGKASEPGALAETTVYGMTPGNLSFATKEYLKRHGLVGQNTGQTPAPVSRNHAPLSHPHHEIPRAVTAPAEKVLDITAIRNQPKLL